MSMCMWGVPLKTYQGGAPVAPLVEEILRLSPYLQWSQVWFRPEPFAACQLLSLSAFTIKIKQKEHSFLKFSCWSYLCSTHSHTLVTQTSTCIHLQNKQTLPIELKKAWNAAQSDKNFSSSSSFIFLYSQGYLKAFVSIIFKSKMQVNNAA